MSLNPVATPINTKSIKMTHLKRNKGFSLLEVLIALGVLAIGLLGLAAMQTMGLKFNHESYQRTQATILLYGMVDRIRANPKGDYTAAGAGFGYTATAPATSPANKCYVGTCTTSEIAVYDQGEWITSISSTLSQGQGSIAIPSTTNLNRYVIGIRWNQNGVQQTQSIEVEL
ncbi:MAG TPA: type IV pilus modification protein PilV [Acidiferrobacteraceae bacterium]|nr:type IV pilus modification protein PilV [Acidiferrobacteraceae bacterium]HEX20316.1 type IV pilus modification protein PilV [Acidiferrobacteraceae bacterium]